MAVCLLAMACRAAGAPDDGAGANANVGRPTLVAIAASDAVGIGASNPDRDNWVTQLGAKLPAGARVVNLGISGATAAQAATQELPVALDAAPSIAVVWLGVNDFQARVSLTAFAADLTRILGALKAQTGARLFVGNLPDLRLLPAFAGRDPAALDAEVEAWNAQIARAAQDAGATVVDIYRSWAAARDRGALVSGDGLHPTTAGYARLAELFWQAIHSGG